VVVAFVTDTSVQVVLDIVCELGKRGRGDLAWLVYHIDGGIESLSIKDDVEWDLVASLVEIPSDLHVNDEAAGSIDKVGSGSS
jgi:hypothetical protein